jgi:hypothetical protein
MTVTFTREMSRESNGWLGCPRWSPLVAVLTYHLVLGHGAYHFRDYRKFELPLSLIVVGVGCLR